MVSPAFTEVVLWEQFKKLLDASTQPNIASPVHVVGTICGVKSECQQQYRHWYEWNYPA